MKSLGDPNTVLILFNSSFVQLKSQAILKLSVNDNYTESMRNKNKTCMQLCQVKPDRATASQVQQVHTGGIKERH